MPNFATGFDWYAQGMIFRPSRLGSVVAVRHLQGPVFHDKEAAEQHGLKLCKEWIDSRLLAVIDRRQKRVVRFPAAHGVYLLQEERSPNLAPLQ